MNNHPKRMPCKEIEALLAGKHIKGAINGHRYDRKLQFISQLEGTPSEHTHVAGERTRSFWKHHKTCTMAKHFTSLPVGLLDSPRTTLVYKNMPGTLTCLSNEKQVTQRFLHHPLEVAAQESIDKKDVKRTLMIGNKHIRLMLCQMLASFHPYRKQKHIAHKTAPYHCRIIAPKVRTAQGASNNGNDGGERTEHQHHRQSHKQLIDTIKKTNHQILENYEKPME